MVEYSTEVTMIKVSAKSRPTAVAGAIAGVIRENPVAHMQAIGAGAVNQAVKAIAIAGGYLRDDHIGIASIPTFTEVSIDGQERTALLFKIIRCDPELMPYNEVDSDYVD